MAGAVAAIWITLCLLFIVFALVWPSYAAGTFNNLFDGKSKKKIPKRVRKDDAWTNGYKDMAYALLKELRGVSMQDEHYTVVNKKITLKEHVFDALTKEPERVRRFKPEQGRTSAKYIAGSPEEWRQYREGGMKFLTDLDEYQGLVLSRRADMLREDKRYTEAKRVIDEIRENGYTVSDEHEEFDRQFKELEG